MNQKNQNLVAIFKKYCTHLDQLILLPNALCLFRILLIVVFLCFYLIPFNALGNPRAGIYFAVGTMCFAAYTDFVDGYIARKFDMISDLGKFLDPLADKLLQLASVTALCVKLYDFPAVWFMFIIFFIKESALMIQDAVLARNNKSFGSARWYGKVSTFVFYLILGALLIGSPFIFEFNPRDTADGFIKAHQIIDSLCAVASFFLLMSFILYSFYVKKLLKHGEDVIKPINEENKKEEN